MNRHIGFLLLAAAALAACAEDRSITAPAKLSADALASTLSCPSGGTPAPGSRVAGGLAVDGVCILDGVTVDVGITVDSGGHLQFSNGTVNGGISVKGCGELDVNVTTNGAGVPLGTTATVNGGIVVTASRACTFPAFSDADISTAVIHGGISVTGTYLRFFTPSICGDDIRGDVVIDNTRAPNFFIGDPDVACAGNTIRGALSMSNSSRFEVESNSVTGSVLLSGSRLQLNGNTIGGSLQCSNGTVMLPGDGADPSGNTVRGANSC